MKARSKVRPEVIAGAVVLGTAVLSLMIVDRDWYRERAHALSMAGRGIYR